MTLLLTGDIVNGIYAAVEQKFTMTSESSSDLLLPASPSNGLINRRKRLHEPGQLLNSSVFI